LLGKGKFYKIYSYCFPVPLTPQCEESLRRFYCKSPSSFACASDRIFVKIFFLLFLCKGLIRGVRETGVNALTGGASLFYLFQLVL